MFGNRHISSIIVFKLLSAYTCANEKTPSAFKVFEVLPSTVTHYHYHYQFQFQNQRKARPYSSRPGQGIEPRAYRLAYQALGLNLDSYCTISLQYSGIHFIALPCEKLFRSQERQHLPPKKASQGHQKPNQIQCLPENLTNQKSVNREPARKSGKPRSQRVHSALAFMSLPYILFHSLLFFLLLNSKSFLTYLLTYFQWSLLFFLAQF